MFDTFFGDTLYAVFILRNGRVDVAGIVIVDAGRCCRGRVIVVWPDNISGNVVKRGVK